MKRQGKKTGILLGIGCLSILLIPESGRAQQRPTRASQEYRFASSPLPSGGKVTMQSVPGNPNQTVVMVSGVPARMPADQASALVPTSERDGTRQTGRSPIVAPRNISFQSPTLGMGPSRPRVFDSDCDCKATQQTAYQAAVADRLPPSLNTGFGGATYARPEGNLLVPNNQFEPTQFQNLPPGTYMGKAIFGQPQSYVDGEPMRNMFRFLFP
ncbi:MAG: hypothetical protein MK106_15185 [Mariniblastus sp.]|nr:hypothetical protein [Mariniblastus sp.]